MKAVFSYVVVLFSAMAYAFLFDRNAGSIMTVFLIVVPIVSVFLSVYASRKMKFEFAVDDTYPYWVVRVVFAAYKPCAGKRHVVYNLGK